MKHWGNPEIMGRSRIFGLGYYLVAECKKHQWIAFIGYNPV